MRKKMISVGILAGFMLSLLVATSAFAQKDEVTLEASFGNVKFPHKSHVEKVKLECTKCHHTWKAGEKSGQVCKDCHKKAAEGKTPSLKDAFHNDCKKCHDDLKKANKPAGPTGCTQCHVKAK